jgi:hypothetical protein
MDAKKCPDTLRNSLFWTNSPVPLHQLISLFILKTCFILCYLKMSLRATVQRSSRHTQCSLPIYDFLAPSFIRPLYRRGSIRCISSSGVKAMATVHRSDDPKTPPSQSSASCSSRAQTSEANTSFNPAPVDKPLTQAQRDFLTAAVSQGNIPFLNSNAFTLPGTALTSGSSESTRRASSPQLESTPPRPHP